MAFFFCSNDPIHSSPEATASEMDGCWISIEGTWNSYAIALNDWPLSMKWLQPVECCCPHPQSSSSISAPPPFCSPGSTSSYTNFLLLPYEYLPPVSCSSSKFSHTSLSPNSTPSLPRHLFHFSSLTPPCPTFPPSLITKHSSAQIPLFHNRSSCFTSFAFPHLLHTDDCSLVKVELSPY